MELLLFQLVLLAASAVSAVIALSAARRAASFDVTRDFDALCVAVGRLQKVTRSEKMAAVRQAGVERQAEELPHAAHKAQLRMVAKQRGLIP